MGGKGTEKLTDNPEYTLLPEKRSSTHHTKPAEYISTFSYTSSSAVFFCSEEPLARLKASAIDEDSRVYISINDALCALIWGLSHRSTPRDYYGGYSGLHVQSGSQRPHSNGFASISRVHGQTNCTIRLTGEMYFTTDAREFFGGERSRMAPL